MAPRTWKSSDPLVKFTSGYRPHRMTKLAIEQKATKELGKRAYETAIRRYERERQEAIAALGQLATLPPTTKRDRAVANAKEHAEWLRLMIAELRRRRSLPKPQRPKPTARRTRVGLLAREVAQHRSSKEDE